jgi:hypothetical protein
MVIKCITVRADSYFFYKIMHITRLLNFICKVTLPDLGIKGFHLCVWFWLLTHVNADGSVLCKSQKSQVKVPVYEKMETINWSMSSPWSHWEKVAQNIKSKQIIIGWDFKWSKNAKCTWSHRQFILFLI